MYILKAFFTDMPNIFFTEVKNMRLFVLKKKHLHSLEGSSIEVTEGCELVVAGSESVLAAEGEFVASRLTLVDGGYANLSSDAVLNEYTHIYEGSNLDIAGEVINNGYLCVHPTGILAIYEGAVVTNNGAENIADAAYIDNGGFTEIKGTVNNYGLMSVGINEEQSELISSALQFGDVTVESILTPRMDIAAIDINMPQKLTGKG